VCSAGCCDATSNDRTVCVAEGAKCGSGTTCSMGTCPRPQMDLGSMMMCPSGTFTTFDDGCTNAASCSFGLHQIDCCGSKLVVPFNHAQTDAFNTAEMAWELTCPACGCAARPNVDSEGKTCQGDPQVTCDGNMCRARCN
jgi:hypothetical protein